MQTSQTLWVKLQTSSKVPIIQLLRIEDWLQKGETLGRSNTGDFMPWLGIAEIAAGNHVFSVVIFIPSLQADSQLWCFFEQWMVSFWEVECHQLQPPGVYQMMPVNSYQPQAWSKYVIEFSDRFNSIPLHFKSQALQQIYKEPELLNSIWMQLLRFLRILVVTISYVMVLQEEAYNFSHLTACCKIWICPVLHVSFFLLLT